MKAISFNRLTFLFLTLTCLHARCATIYTDNFANPDDSGSPIGLDGDAPTQANSIAGGSSGALWATTSQWASDGAKSAGTANAFLPVSIPSTYHGGTYTLTVDVTVAAISGYDWIAAGFAATTSGVYWDLQAPWMFLRGRTWPGGGSGLLSTPNEVQAYASNLVGGANLSPAIGTADQFGPYTGTFKIELDTAPEYWSVAWSFKPVGGEFNNFHTYTFSEAVPNPSITHVGVGGVGSATGSIDNFTLSYVPEPSVSLLCAFASLALLRRNRSL
jgi:hypothetical protein